MAALGQVIGARVKVAPRETWRNVLRASGEATRLAEPFPPYARAWDARGFEYAVASGMPANSGGIHHVRTDETDPPEARINTDSDDVIEDLSKQPVWSRVLEVAGREPSDEVRAIVDRHVFSYPNLRNKDHHWPTVPEDIARAKPKEPDGGR